MVVIQYARLFQERGAEVPAGTYGTRGTPTFIDLRILSESIEGGPDLTDETDAESALAITGQEDAGKTYGGGLTQKVRVDDGIGDMLLSLFGAVLTTQDDVGPPIAEKHVYIPLDDFADTAPSYGLDIGVEKAREYRFSGLLVNALTITKTEAGEVNLTWEIIAKDRTATAYDGAHVPVYSVKTKLQTVFLATLFGTAVVWENLTIVLRRNWDQTKNFSGRTLPKAEIGPFTIDITGSVKFENATPNFEASLEAGTEGELTIHFRGPTIVTTFFEELIIELDRMRIKSMTPAHIVGTTRKIESINLVGMLPAAGDWIKATLENSSLTPATYN